MKRLAICAIFACVCANAQIRGFAGDWKLIGIHGTTAPEDFTMHVDQTESSVDIAARWALHEDAHALTLIGIATPHVRFTTASHEDLNQVGPFVLHSRTHWDGTRLVTTWHTSDFMGKSFTGTWTRSLSPDGRRQRLDVKGDSSDGKFTRAILTFERLSGRAPGLP